MFLLSDKDGVQRIMSGAGDELGETIEACIRWCEAKDCQVLLNFNGVERHINKGTYVKGLSDNWYDSGTYQKHIQKYVSLQDTREKKLNDLGI
jgi:hypothetical protein